jgi:hypothetical protein
LEATHSAEEELTMKLSNTFAFAVALGLMAGCSAAPESQQEGVSAPAVSASQVKTEATDPCASTCDDTSDPYVTQNCSCCHRILAAHRYIDCYE